MNILKMIEDRAIKTDNLAVLLGLEECKRIEPVVENIRQAAMAAFPKIKGQDSLVAYLAIAASCVADGSGECSATDEQMAARTCLFLSTGYEDFDAAWGAVLFASVVICMVPNETDPSKIYAVYSEERERFKKAVKMIAKMRKL